MDLINTNRLRLSVSRRVPERGEEFHLFRFTSWKSRDHGMPRQETTATVESFGIVIRAKWRPDGRAAGGNLERIPPTQEEKR